MTTPDDSLITLNFSWLEEHRVAGCRGPRTDAHLRTLADAGVQALVRLEYDRETGMSRQRVTSAGLDDFYEPFTDGTAPSQDLIDRVIGFMTQAAGVGKPIAVSCLAGCGRTGTLLACHLVSTGRSADDAIQHLIEVRPCSRELLCVPGQRDAVVEFHRRRSSQGPANPALQPTPPSRRG